MTSIRGLLDKDQEVIRQGSGGFKTSIGGYKTRIRRLYDKDQRVIRQGSGGYKTRIRRL